MNRNALLPIAALLGGAGLLATVVALSSPSAGAGMGRGPVFDGHMGARTFGAGTHVVDLASEGIYDPSTYGWAVVFDNTTITVEAGAVVTFLNHPSRAPVIWHATGDVVIDGEVILDGAVGHTGGAQFSFAEPGPGGFRGGRGSEPTANASSNGLGPGAGRVDPSSTGSDEGGPGSYGGLGGGNRAGEVYGAPGVFPLVGGSGGAGGAGFDSHGTGGGAGGGALLIASDASLSVSGTISATGAPAGGSGGSGGTQVGGGGSGGAIRMTAESILLDAGATVLATGGSSPGILGGYGRVRIETNGAGNLTLDPGAFVDPTPEIAIARFEVIPALEPSLQVTRLSPDAGANWIDVEALTVDPTSTIVPGPLADVVIDDEGPIRFEIRARNVDPGEVVIVWIRHTKGFGTHNTAPVESTPLVGTFMESFAEADVELAGGVSAIQLRVDYED